MMQIIKGKKVCMKAWRPGMVAIQLNMGKTNILFPTAINAMEWYNKHHSNFTYCKHKIQQICVLPQSAFMM